MKLNRKHLIVLAVIMVPLAGTWAYRHKNATLAEARGQTESSGQADSKTSDRGAPRPSKKEIRDKARAWQEQLLADHPDMAVSYREVAKENNGYLQWLDFMDECRANGMVSGNDINLPDDIKDLFNGEVPWDASRAGKWLEANRALVDRIIALGMLPDQSAAGIDSERIAATSSAVPHNLAAILLARARYALEGGDASAAMESLTSLIGSARHVDGIEIPSYLNMVTSAGIRAKMLEFAIGEGVAGADAETLQQLRDLISRDRPDARSFARFARGDWHVMSEHLLLPQLLGEGKLMSDVPPSFLKQPELIAATYADVSMDLARHWDKASLRELLAPMPEPSANVPAGLSVEDREHFKMLTHGLIQGLSKGWALQQIQRVMTEAALAISLGEEAPVDPVTGKAFVIDEASGTLRLPDDPVFSDVLFEPMKIPARRN